MTTSSPPDADLIGQILKGRKDVFRLLVDRYAPLCAYYLSQRMQCPADHIKDLLQEAFLRAFQRLTQLQDPHRFKPWLLSICRNLVLDQRRRKEKEVPDSLLPSDSPSSGDVESATVAKLTIHEALSRLPSHHREMLEMKYFWELTHQEIADLMQIPVGTVKTGLFQARLRLRHWLVPEENSDSRAKD